MANCFSTGVPKLFIGIRIVSSRDGAGTTGYPHNERSWTSTSHQTQNLTQNRPLDYNVKAKPTKVIEENTGRGLQDFGNP